MHIRTFLNVALRPTVGMTIIGNVSCLFWAGAAVAAATASNHCSGIPSDVKHSFAMTAVVQEGTAVEHFKRGFELHQKGNLDGAIDEYRTALRSNPNVAEVHHVLGIALAGKGDLSGAIAEQRTALGLKPNLAGAHVHLGFLLGAKGDMESAMAEYKAAIQIDPNLPRAHYGVGMGLAANGNLEGAIAEYRIALQLNPNDAEVHHVLGLALSLIANPAWTVRSPNTALPCGSILICPRRISILAMLFDTKATWKAQ